MCVLVGHAGADGCVDEVCGDVGDAGEFDGLVLPRGDEFEFAGVDVGFFPFDEFVECGDGRGLAGVGPCRGEVGEVLGAHGFAACLFEVAGGDFHGGEAFGGGVEADCGVDGAAASRQ